MHNTVNNEMLSNTPNNRSESLKQLPIDPIIEHIEQHDCLVPYAHIWVPKQLNQQLLNPIEAILVISNLGHKQCPLYFLKILHLLLELPFAEFVDVF